MLHRAVVWRDGDGSALFTIGASKDMFAWSRFHLSTHEFSQPPFRIVR
jgi:hypothetical protein